MAITNTVNAYSNNETAKTAIASNYIRAKTAIGSTPSTISTITAMEYGDGRDFTTVLTLNGFVVGALASAAAALAVGNIIYTFPAGAHFTTVAYKSISLTCDGTAVAADLGIGSLIGSGAQSVLSGVGATAEDYLTGVATTTGASGGTAVAQLVAVTSAIATNVAANVKDVYLNAAGTWNANNTTPLTAVGTVVIKWTVMS